MITPELVNFIRAQQKAGVSTQDIASTLSSQGWTSVDINNAFIAAQAPEVPVPPTPSSTPLPQAVGGKSHVLKIAAISTGALLVCAVIAGGTYAYSRGLISLPFGSPYSEETFVTSLLSRARGIETVTYGMTGSLKVEPRDSDAQPFAFDGGDTALMEKYERDYAKISEATDIIMSVGFEGVPYPLDLNDITVYGKKPSLSGVEYIPSKDRQNFTVSVTLETDEAVKALNEYLEMSSLYSEGVPEVIFEGKKVTFTDGAGYVYIPSELPKPFFANLAEMSQEFPAELAASFGVGATVDLTKENSDWKAMFDATGDFGDLSYKFNADLLRKETDYYFRINNIPGIFSQFIPIVKGEWVKVDSDAATSSDAMYMSPLSELSEQLAEGEEEYKKSRAEVAAFTADVAKIADETKVIRFKNSPTQEIVEGKRLYRYDLALAKEAIPDFYTKVAEAAKKYDSLKDTEIFTDAEYLKSKEFSDLFDYYTANTSLTVWVDRSGIPAILEYSLRVVPPDEARQLAGKQIRLTLSMTLSDVNKPVIIETPNDARPLEDIIKESENPYMGMLVDARESGVDASTKVNLSNLRATAELHYDDMNGSYAGLCESAGVATTKGSLPEGTTFACTADPDEYVMYASLGEPGTYYCIDSMGSANTINEVPTTMECPMGVDL